MIWLKDPYNYKWKFSSKKKNFFILENLISKIQIYKRSKIKINLYKYYMQTSYRNKTWNQDDM